MPYQIELSGSQYAVVDDKGKTVGTHPTKGEAEDQVRALYANVPDDALRGGVLCGSPPSCDYTCPKIF